MDLLSKAYEDHFDYYHLITGQDYLASKPEDFDRILGNDRKCYIQNFPLPKKGWWNYDLIQLKTFTSHFNIRDSIFHKVLHHVVWDGQKILHIRRPLPSYPLYGGSVYCSLTDEAVNVIINSDITHDLIHRTRNTFCCEEIFLQTVLANSPLKEKMVNDQLKFTDWSSLIKYNQPALLNEDYYDKIISSKNLFCRKVDSKKSAKLLDLIDEHILENNNGNYTKQ